MRIYERIRKNIVELKKRVIDMKIDDSISVVAEEIKLEENSYITSIVINTRNLSEINNEKLQKIFISSLIDVFKSKSEGIELHKGFTIEENQIEMVFVTEEREDIYPCFDIAVTIDTFIDLFNKLIVENGLEEIKAGIGVACSERLEIKYGDRDMKKREILSHDEIVTRASRIALLGDVRGGARLNISYAVYENILKKLIDKKGNSIRNEFEEKFNISQGTYFASSIKDEKFQSL